MERVNTNMSLSLNNNPKSPILQQAVAKLENVFFSEYQLSQIMPKEIQSQLPTIEEIEASLRDTPSKDEE